MQIVHEDLEQAIEKARTLHPAIVYFDVELNGYGVYKKGELDGRGSWICPAWVVHDTTRTDEENEERRKQHA